jgi:hypothetical protein
MVKPRAKRRRNTRKRAGLLALVWATKRLNRILSTRMKRRRKKRLLARARQEGHKHEKWLAHRKRCWWIWLLGNGGNDG